MVARRLFLSLLLASALWAQAPAITSIQNPASNILPGVPNFGIAQGQIFVLYGNNIGPATIVQAPSLPLSTNLGGTSIKVTAGATSFDAPIIYTLKTQVAAVMPSGVPAGPANVQLIYNGTPGNSFATTIVSSNFGISTVDQTGTGQAVITFPDYSLVTYTKSAKPGDAVVLWGTGLGAANNDSNIATNGDLGTPIQVFVGGVEAKVLYRGRSAGPGLDQINITVPQGVSGCYVSVVVQTNTSPVTVSNVPTVSIAANGGQCSDVPFSQSNLYTSFASKGNAALGLLSLDAEKNQFVSGFFRFTTGQWFSQNLLTSISSGSCVTSVVQGSSSSGGSGIPNATGLDAGSTLTLTPPSGPVVNATSFLKGLYTANLSSVVSGSYTVSNGSGGADISAFSVSIPSPSAVQWTNSNIATINRAQGQVISWSGGDANTILDINGYSGAGPIGASFECQVVGASGQFTIPAAILQAMPPAKPAGFMNGNISVSFSGGVILTLPGIDAALAAWNTKPVSVNVSYQ